jgi:hypothetical protein
MRRSTTISDVGRDGTNEQATDEPRTPLVMGLFALVRGAGQAPGGAGL